MNNKMPHISIIPLIISAAILAYVAVTQFAALSRGVEILTPYYGRRVKIRGTIIGSAEKKDGKVKIRIGSLILNDDKKVDKCQAYVVLKNTDAELSRSDSVELSGIVEAGFGSYAGYLYEPKLLIHSKPDPPDYALTIREKISSELKKYLGADEAGLALGYLFGDKASMSDKLVEQIRFSGLSHLVVTSGFHLSILVNMVRRMFGKISRAAVLFGVFFFALLFISIAGASASMSRAGLMSLITTVAWYVGRKIHPGRLLLYVATITVIISPSIILDVGWQLSFASFSGIVFLAPVLTKFLYEDKNPPGAIASGLIVSFAAQLFCLPVSIYYFGMFSVVGIIAGLIIAPTIAFLLLTLCACAVFSIVSIPILAEILAFISLAITKIHLLIISYASSIPWATIKSPINDARIFILYIPIICILLILKNKTKYNFRPRYELEKSQDYGKILTC